MNFKNYIYKYFRKKEEKIINQTKKSMVSDIHNISHYLSILHNQTKQTKGKKIRTMKKNHTVSNNSCEDNRGVGVYTRLLL